MSLPRVLTFLAMLTTILGSMGFYMGTRLIPGSWIGQTRVMAWLALVAVVAVMPATMLLSRVLKANIAEALGWVGFSVMGLFLLTLTVLLIRDAGWLGARIAGALPVDPERRAALLDTTNLGVLAVAAGLFAVGFVRTRGKPAIVSVRVPIVDLPAALEGFSIAQISDIHVGSTIKRGFIETIVAEVNALEADFIAVTGDVVDGSVAELREHTQPLAGLKARHGAFFVTGNHEYYSGAQPWLDEMTRLGMKTLVNEHHVVDHDGTSIVVAGVTDISSSGMEPAHKSDPHAAVAGAPADTIKVLLAHQPRSAYEAQKAGFHLQLSGHTHGGQFFPGTILVHLVQPFVKGLNRLEQMWVYTNRGTGYWGPPIRHGEGGEITHLTLVRA